MKHEKVIGEMDLRLEALKYSQASSQLFELASSMERINELVEAILSRKEIAKEVKP